MSGTGGKTPGSPSGTGGDMKQQAGQVAEQVKDQAGQLKDKVAETATGALEERKTQATSGLGNVSETIRQTGEQLRSQDQAMIADYVDRAAEQVDRLSGYLRGHDMQQIVGDVERFARREPTLFLGGAFVLGLVGARFLKSSGQAIEVQASGRQGRQDYGQGEQGYGTRAAMSSYSSYAALEHTQPLPVQSAGSTPYAPGGTSSSPTPSTGGGKSGMGTGGSVQPSRPGGTMPSSPAPTAPTSTSSGTGAPSWQGGAARPTGTGMPEPTSGGAARVDRASELTTDTRSGSDAGE